MSLQSLLPDTLRRTADMAAAFAIEHPGVFRDFIDASLAQEYPMAMRASRVVYLVAAEAPGLVRPHLAEIRESLPVLRDQSVIRNFLHIFEHFIPEMEEEELVHLLNTCFNFIEDFSNTIAVRTYSLKLIYLVSQRIPEIKPEVMAIIRHHMPESPAAFTAQARQILDKLQKEVIFGK